MLRPWQTRTHCCRHIVAHDVSRARKRAGHRINLVFPCRANWETFPEHHARDANWYQFSYATKMAAEDAAACIVVALLM